MLSSPGSEDVTSASGDTIASLLPARILPSPASRQLWLPGACRLPLHQDKSRRRYRRPADKILPAFFGRTTALPRRIFHCFSTATVICRWHQVSATRCLHPRFAARSSGSSLTIPDARSRYLADIRWLRWRPSIWRYSPPLPGSSLAGH